ncbi:MAG: helix-turn-helix domain-containing protein [Thermodesulfovibrionales bacterium]|nr:helix-turn-helix domain-containing protein [Thermodesulfovibrionales bacterium]
MSDLKEKRLKLGKDLKEIADITRIKQSYLKAIEDEDFQRLPVEVYTKAYIKQYAKFLEISDEGILSRYNDFLTKQNTKTSHTQDKPPVTVIDEPQKIPPTKDETKRTINYKPLLNVSILIVIVVGVISLILWHQSRQSEIKEIVRYTPPPPLDTPKEPEKPLNADNTLTPQNNLETTSSQIQKPLQDISSTVSNTDSTTDKTRHNLNLIATDKVWIQVLIDNKEKKEITLNPGDTISYNANSSFSLLIGNAGGIKINFNGKIIDKLGDRGAVIRLKLPNEDRRT